MRLRFLGTGTSFGIPVIGCRCATCTSADPRDRRTRHGALLESDDGARRLLVDTPPELRLQLLDAGTGRVDAVWFTHGHADHVHGIDDLRAFSAHQGSPITAFAGPETTAVLRTKFDYIFDPSYTPPEGTSKPAIRIIELAPHSTVDAAGFHMRPLPLPHGDTVVYGFRTGELAYITDAKFLPDDVLAAIRGVQVLVLNALWFGKPHPTHFNVEEAVVAARTVGAAVTYLTHLTHRQTHTELERRLPPEVRPAYDGLVVEL